VLRRRDAQTLRDLIWMRNRKMLRARAVTLRSVPVARQIEPVQVGLFGTAACGVSRPDYQLAAMMGCGRSTFWQRVRSGAYPAPVKDCGSTRWRVSDLAAARSSHADHQAISFRR
jgi:predicted DNA-binding transcriptional regulator AlpA